MCRMHTHIMRMIWTNDSIHSLQLHLQFLTDYTTTSPTPPLLKTRQNRATGKGLSVLVDVQYMVNKSAQSSCTTCL